MMDAVQSRQWSTSTLEEGLALLSAASPSTLVASMVVHNDVPPSPGIKNKIQAGGLNCALYTGRHICFLVFGMAGLGDSA